MDAQVKVHVVRGRRTIPLETSDVSYKGLFLRTEEPPPVRSLLRLRVKLPQGEIEAHAMAVHVTVPAPESSQNATVGTDAADQTPNTRSGVGLQFWGLSGPDRVAWDDFVRELIQQKRAAAMLAKKKFAAASETAAKTTPKPDGAGKTPSGVRRAAKG